MNFKSNETFASQIVKRIKTGIFGGRYAAGSKLKAIRELAAECEVNPSVVVKAYAELEADGLIFTDGTLGKFVTCETETIKRKREEFLLDRFEEFKGELRECGVSEEEFLCMTKKYRA